MLCLIGVMSCGRLIFFIQRPIKQTSPLRDVLIDATLMVVFSEILQ